LGIFFAVFAYYFNGLYPATAAYPETYALPATGAGSFLLGLIFSMLPGDSLF